MPAIYRGQGESGRRLDARHAGYLESLPMAKAARVKSEEPKDHDTLYFPDEIAREIGLGRNQINAFKRQGCPFYGNKTTIHWARTHREDSGRTGCSSILPLPVLWCTKVILKGVVAEWSWKLAFHASSLRGEGIKKNPAGVTAIMKVEPDDLRRWGHDQLTKLIDEHVTSMPDRPKVVVTIIVNGRDFDEANAQALKPMAPQHFTTQPIQWLNAAFRIIYLGFDSSDSKAFLDFWAVAAAMPRLDEMAIYIDGKAEFRVDRLLHGPPPPGSEFYTPPNPKTTNPYE